ncbi:HNH endonuclease signature motif containing protein [Luteipulveratus mongoliensis]|uniref:HNH endonuclease signature motif containing protein n=1 Tax=Luteipulveratus mongoliensis TaxID=571913 RepID=UPI000696C99B|nr:HNH endonuclease signature motif containing protein [Luteipulveratus mongoliensis]
MAVQPTDQEPSAGRLLQAARSAVEALSEIDGAPLWPAAGAQVEELLQLIGQARAAVDRVEVALVREGKDRGLHREQGFGVVDWVRLVQGRAGLSPDPAHVARLNRVADTAVRPAARAVWERFAAGSLPLGKADRLARFEADVSPVAGSGEVAESLDILLGAAEETPQQAGLTPRELQIAIRRAGLLLKPERDLVAEQDAARRGRALYKQPGPAGLSAYRVLLDPEGAAVVDAAIAALSTPIPGEGGEPDPRSVATRRADALIEVVRRGVSSPGEQPKAAKAQMVVTIPLAQLIEELAGAGPSATGPGRCSSFGASGAGITATGEVLAADVVRRMACDAGIIPMVLGSAGEVLDVGREERLFTPAQRRALWQRDGGCTFPGCTIPPQWCDAHHVVWWSRGGSTSLDNAALLCQRHHTLVHRRDLSATVTGTQVVWQIGVTGHT